MPVIQLLSGDQQSFSILKSKIGLSLALDGDTEDREFECSTAEEHYYHTVMFQTYNCLLNQGWGAFATDTQLRGVVAKPISETEFHVASLTNCTINYKGRVEQSNALHRNYTSMLN